MSQKYLRQEWAKALSLRIQSLKRIISEAVAMRHYEKIVKFWPILQEAEAELRTL